MSDERGYGLMINRSLAIGFDPFVMIRRVTIQCVTDQVDFGCDQMDPWMIDLMITLHLRSPEARIGTLRSTCPLRSRDSGWMLVYTSSTP